MPTNSMNRMRLDTNPLTGSTLMERMRLSQLWEDADIETLAVLARDANEMVRENARESLQKKTDSYRKLGLTGILRYSGFKRYAA